MNSAALQRLVQHFLAGSAALCFAVIIAAYAGLIPLGQWQDEWDTLPQLSQAGWSGYWHRVLTWSPRPLSELLLFGYANLVHAAGAPLIAPVLAFIWIVLLLALVWLPSLLFRENDGSWWAASLALFCVFLVGHPVGEMFYWPQGGAMAYMLSLAGIAGATWLACATGLKTATSRHAASVLLTLAVLSAEASAIFTLILASLAVAVRVVQQLAGAAGEHRPPLRWLMLPAGAACLVLAWGLSGRLGTSQEIFGNPAVAHHAVAAVVLGLREFAGELASMAGNAKSLLDIGDGIAAKALFFLGICGWSARAMPRHPDTGLQPMPLLFGAACLGAASAIIAAAYYQFGLACCERHGTLRQALLHLGLFSIAWWTGRRVRGANALPLFSALWPLFLFAAVGIGATRSWPALQSDYASIETRLAAARQNWMAGRNGTDSFTYRVLAPGRIVGGPSLPDGTYAAGAPAPGNAPHIIAFFRKKEVTFDAHAFRSAPLDAIPAGLAAPPEPGAQCIMDRVNGRGYTGGAAPLRGDGTVALLGWVVPAQGLEPRIWVAALQPNGSRRYFETIQEDRPDVAAALERPGLRDAGFRAVVDLARLPHSRQLKLLAVSQGRASECSLTLEVTR